MAEPVIHEKPADAIEMMRTALERIIELNVQYAVDLHGDASKAETMACVKVCRGTLAAVNHLLFRLEAEQNGKQPSLITAFVQGAKWWEYTEKCATMWPSDQDRAHEAAVDKMNKGTLGMDVVAVAIKKTEHAEQDGGCIHRMEGALFNRSDNSTHEG